MSRFQFVDDHCDTFPVKWLCQILEVSRSGFYRWRTSVSGYTVICRCAYDLMCRCPTCS